VLWAGVTTWGATQNREEVANVEPAWKPSDTWVVDYLTTALGAAVSGDRTDIARNILECSIGPPAAQEVASGAASFFLMLTQEVAPATIADLARAQAVITTKLKSTAP
jgi:hypothetical protein